MSETLDHDLSCDEASGIGEPASMALWFECYQFLVHEVALLDDNRMEDWLALLSSDIHYTIPVRITRRRNEDPISAGTWHMNENLASIKMRIARLATSSAWGEDPPSRTRRIVGNLRCTVLTASNVRVVSNVHIYYGRGDASDHTIIAAERHDEVERVSEGLRLRRREVLLSHATLPVQSLGIFI